MKRELLFDASYQKAKMQSINSIVSKQNKTPSSQHQHEGNAKIMTACDTMIRTGFVALQAVLAAPAPRSSAA